MGGWYNVEPTGHPGGAEKEGIPADIFLGGRRNPLEAAAKER